MKLDWKAWLAALGLVLAMTLVPDTAGAEHTGGTRALDADHVPYIGVVELVKCELNDDSTSIDYEVKYVTPPQIDEYRIFVKLDAHPRWQEDHGMHFGERMVLSTLGHAGYSNTTILRGTIRWDGSRYRSHWDRQPYLLSLGLCTLSVYDVQEWYTIPHDDGATQS